MGSQQSTDDGTSLRRSAAKTNLAEDDEQDGLLTTEDRPLPKTEELLDPLVLATFQCPFQQDFDFPLCDLDRCPFGHLPQPEGSAVTLRPVPAWICQDRLLDQCASTDIEPLNDQLSRCGNGLHPTTEMLADAELLVEQLAKLIMKPAAVSTNDCVVCLKPIPSTSDGLHAFLENCQHQFCSTCIIAWRSRFQRPSMPYTTEFNCPTCRTASARIMLWPQAAPTNRQHLFGLQKQCFGLMIGPQVGASIHEDFKSEDKFIVTYKRCPIRGQINRRGNRGARGGGGGGGRQGVIQGE